VDLRQPEDRPCPHPGHHRAFGAALLKLRIYSDFADLLPQNHPYIQTYNRLKENFGGANMIVMAVEVEKGTIFNDETLALIHKATQGVDNLPGVNHNLVSSLTHRTARKIFLDEQGALRPSPTTTRPRPPARWPSWSSSRRT
jgi:hypothetical protein